MNFYLIDMDESSRESQYREGQAENLHFRIGGSTSFRQQHIVRVPSPDHAKALNAQSGNPGVRDKNRPPPLILQQHRLAVKYGADVQGGEADCQTDMMQLYNHKVPVPEVFACVQDKGQTFIYMDLIDGDTLMERWGTMNEDERLSVCRELRSMVDMWRSTSQNDHPLFEENVGERLVAFIGGWRGWPINDMLFRGRHHLTGPFVGPDAVQQFHEACGIDIPGDVPIVFTHNNLSPPNIMLSKGPYPKVIGILDWGQAGWYPAYWEYCKARRVKVLPRLMSIELQDEWEKKYIPLIIDPVDEETVYNPWLYFSLSNP